MAKNGLEGEKEKKKEGEASMTASSLLSGECPKKKKGRAAGALPTPFRIRYARKVRKKGRKKEKPLMPCGLISLQKERKRKKEREIGKRPPKDNPFSSIVNKARFGHRDRKKKGGGRGERRLGFSISAYIPTLKKKKRGEKSV